MRSEEIAIVIPMKPPRLAKTRLAGRLTLAQREALSLGMFTGVVRAALDSSVGRVWVVGGDEIVQRAAQESGAKWQEDGGLDLNGTLQQAFQAAFAAGLVPMYLPADLPFLTAEEVGGAVKASSYGKSLVLSPARRDAGTNAIIVPLGSAFRPALGVGSFRRHQDLADRLGLPVGIYDTPGLGLDLDTVEDLEAFEQIEPGLLARLTSEATPQGAGTKTSRKGRR